MFGNQTIRSLVLAGVFAGLAIGSDVDSLALLDHIRSKVRANAGAIPRLVCRQRLERWDYNPAGAGKSCGTIGDDEARNRRSQLKVSDRASLDVMLTSESELYAWPGSQSFSAETPSVLLGGGFSGSGDFAGFLESVFAGPTAKIEYRGPCEAPATSIITCVRYSFDVPKAGSKYTLRTSKNEVAVGLHGTFDVNPATADLLSLTAIPSDIHNVPGVACDLRTRMTYTTKPIAAGVFTIPESTEKLYLASDGAFFRNRTSYQGCREYQAESAISFDDEQTADGPVGGAPASVLPDAGTRIELSLAGTIDSKKTAAGDAIEAKLLRAARDKAGHTLAANTVFHGHVMQMEHVYGNPASVVMTLRFDSMEWNGAKVNVQLSPAGPMDGNGNQVYRFLGGDFNLDSRFVSKWSFGGVVK